VIRTLVAAAIVLGACDGGVSNTIVQLSFGGVPCESGSRQASAGAIVSGDPSNRTEKELWAPQACGDSTVTIDPAIDEQDSITAAGTNNHAVLCYAGGSVHIFSEDDFRISVDVPALDAACAANAICPEHVDAMNPLYQLGLELAGTSTAFCPSLFGITVQSLLLSNNANTAAPSGNHTEAQFGLAEYITFTQALEGSVITTPDPLDVHVGLYSYAGWHPYYFRRAPSLYKAATSELSPGDYFVFAQVLKGEPPEADPVNHYQYAFVFDADGNTTNNYAPLPQYPADFFKDTDRWYELLYTPAAGWTTKVSTARGSTITPAQSDAQTFVVGSVIFLLVPASEFTTQTPAYRFTAFRHTGNYGLQPPHDFDGYVDPPVAMGLHAFTR
jgi:hypothetical protein